MQLTAYPSWNWTSGDKGYICHSVHFKPLIQLSLDIYSWYYDLARLPSQFNKLICEINDEPKRKGEKGGVNIISKILGLFIYEAQVVKHLAMPYTKDFLFQMDKETRRGGGEEELSRWPVSRIQYPVGVHLCWEYTSGSVSKIDQVSSWKSLGQSSDHKSQEE